MTNIQQPSDKPAKSALNLDDPKVRQGLAEAFAVALDFGYELGLAVRAGV